LKRSRCGWALLGIIWAWSAWGVIFPTPAAAQTGEFRLPRSTEPELRPPQLAPEKPARPGPQIKTPESAPIQAPPGAEDVRFVLSDLEFQGVTVYPLVTTVRMYQDKVGKEVSLADIFAIADKLQRLYRKDGYFLARVILPQQTTDEGKLRIQVFEGFISDVKIEGDIGPANSVVKECLDRIPSERPLKLKTLERYLLLANDIPGVTVKGLLRPSEVVGAAQLVAAVDRKAVNVQISGDNLGSSYTGVYEASGLVSLNSFTPLGDGWSVGGLLSDPTSGFSQQNQRVLQVSGAIHPWSNGMYFKMLSSIGRSNPGGSIAQFDVINDKLLVNGTIGYPVIRSRELNLFAEAGVDFINSDTDIFSDMKFSRDKLRVLSLTAYGDYHDAWRGANFFSLGMRQGLPLFDASQSGDDYLSRSDGSGVFTTMNARASRLQPIYGPFSFYWKASGQYAFSNVLIDEEFGVGGAQFGRGYNPSELSADHGVGFTSELQFTRPLKFFYLDRYQLFSFYDFGDIWDRGTDQAASLASTGGGVRGWFTHDFSMEFAVAKPLTHMSLRADDTKDAQILFRALANF